MKKVLGLDLGTTSIGWALVNQAENDTEKSSIIRAGVRVNPLSSDEKDSYEKGRDITTNADRRLKRCMRRNLQRYKLRREKLIEVLTREGWINDSSCLSEGGNKSTFETYRLRAEAVTEEITLEQFSRVLLMINKKRGYKSSRKMTGDESGTLVDGMSVARELYDKEITPGQYCLNVLKNGGKYLPDFYKSDLQEELDRIFDRQKVFYPDILTEETRKALSGKSKMGAVRYFKDTFGILTADNKGKDKKLQSYIWRNDALSGKQDVEVVAYVIADVSGAISSSSGYLGSISDRSKELYFNHETVGQYLWRLITNSPGTSLKNITFYRQDYLDEFDKLWEKQAEFHSELTADLKREIRDIVIFYQRRLKSQKGLISHCEFEKNHRVAPKSSLLFQEFKIWQNLNNVVITDSETGECRELSQEEKEKLASGLRYKNNIPASEALYILFGKKGKLFEINYRKLEGNATIAAIAGKLIDIVNIINESGNDVSKMRGEDIEYLVSSAFKPKGFNSDILVNDDLLNRLWHLVYSYEGDKSRTGDESLVKKISEMCSMEEDYARILSKVTFVPDYGSLSSRAMRKILPFLKEGNRYDKACFYAGYNHSHSLTAGQVKDKVLLDKLENLPKNSLRNPVVEKILNQMINVVNQVSERYGKPDEIHIEMARELKQDKKKREETYNKNQETAKDNERIEQLLHDEFGMAHVRKSDIVRYKLYEELTGRGYKTLYSNRYIPREALFSKDIDIEHIIPQSVMFNDSFSNKTLEYRAVNIEKGDMTAVDYMEGKGEMELQRYKADVEDLVKSGKISRTKGKNLLMKFNDIPENFLNRELSDSQYISRKAREILGSFVGCVMPTSGSVTARLREDWQLVDVMKELNLPKYKKAGLVFEEKGEDGKNIAKIQDWTKRNDHRHHAMDAITIAFTKQAHIQYLNSLNAKSDKSSAVYAIQQAETTRVDGKRIFLPPMPLDELRADVRKELDSVLVSIKAKNKVVTRNVNKTRTRNGYNTRVTLTPRGALHKETVYGLRHVYEKYKVPVGSKLTMQEVLNVASQAERNALLARLELYGGDPGKAFTGKNSPEKNPIFIDAVHSAKIGKTVECVRLKEVYSVRKDIDANLKLDKVLDAGVRKILKARLDEFGENAAKAFSNLDENPIWLNKEKGISIKKVTIAENFDLVPIHEKKDHFGRIVLDSSGQSVPSDYVNLRNNHHIAIYRDAEGNPVEKVVSFFEALDRVSNGLTPVDYNWKRDEGYKFLFSMKINEMFVFPNPETGFDPSEIDLTEPENYSRIAPNLFRVQKLSSNYYVFRHHTETTIDDKNSLKDMTWKRVTSMKSLEGAVKVRINHIGEIVSVGEYD